MGAIYFSIDPGLVTALKTCLPLQFFVETGTFNGDSIENVRSLFEKLYSVEIADAYYQKACERFKGDSAIELFHGASPDFLQRLRAGLAEKSVIYWLDAHWCVAEEPTGGQTSQCPLLQELEALEKLNEQSVVIIDDARLFLATPPAPHETKHWPDFDAILGKLRALSSVHRVSVLNDTILFTPPAAADVLHEYARHHSYDLLHELNKARRFAEVQAECKELDRLNSASNRHIEKLEAQLAKTSRWKRMLRRITG